jgi:predicted flap endonuclease-1-like 5' DNA nuclease
MSLTESSDNVLYYSCLDNPEEHTYRYDLVQKKWEKIIIKRKLILHYNENPCEKPAKVETSVAAPEFVEALVDSLDESETVSNLVVINGIGAKRAKELELVGVTSISDLASCSPKSLSEKTGIPISQISNWIVQANELAEKALILSA